MRCGYHRGLDLSLLEGELGDEASREHKHESIKEAKRRVANLQHPAGNVLGTRACQLGSRSVDSCCRERWVLKFRRSEGVCGGTPDDNTTTTVPGELPATGSESANPLQIGAILLAGGVMLFAIARRRIPAAPRPTG